MQPLFARFADIWTRRYVIGSRKIDAAHAAVGAGAPAVVVTGGSRGIGYAIAKCFAGNGHRVAIVARNETDLTAAAARLARDGYDVLAIACDITSTDAANRITAALDDAGLYADILVNNAGIGISGPFAENSDEAIAAALAINIGSLTRLTHAFLPAMLQRASGGILNLSSLGAKVPGPYQAVYYASKSYVTALTEAIASENAGQGVRFCVVLPGPVNTGFHADMGADTSLYRRVVPPLSPDQVARSSYRGFTNGRRVIVPGIVNKLLYVALKLLPNAITVPFTRALLRPPPSAQ